MESLGDQCRHERNSDSSNHLRELLRLREEESGAGNGDGGSNVTVRTLGSVLSTEKRSLSNRTLLDIIREDSTKYNKKTWKNLKDKLLLKLVGAAWTSSVHIPVSDVVLPASTSNSSSNNGMVMGRHSTRIPDTELTQNLEPSPSETVEEPVRMSLMALLAETDREMGIDGAFDDDGVEEEEVEVQENCGGISEGGGGIENVCEGEYNSCCVCMVRHKGAALIPCGHTFCRLCSRELWVKRGNCPLCNGYILEILDIF